MLERTSGFNSARFDEYGAFIRQDNARVTNKTEKEQSCVVDELFSNDVTYSDGRLDCSIKAPSTIVPTKSSSIPDRMIEIAMGKLGTSKEKLGLDCSGFVRWTAKMAGFPLESLIDPKKGANGSSQMLGSFVQVPENDVKTGDLVFFKMDRSSPNPATHVGFIINNEDGSKSVLHMTNHGVKLYNLDQHATKTETWRDCIVPGGFVRNPAA